VAQAARIRLRPVMMTTAATVAGHFPDVVTGPVRPHELNWPRARRWNDDRTIFTLFIVPSLYMLIAKEHHEKSLAERKKNHR